MLLKPGDKVIFLNEKGGGVIVSINKKVARVLTDEGFEIPYPLDQLVLISEELPQPESEETVEDDLEEAMGEFDLNSINVNDLFKGKDKLNTPIKVSKSHATRTGELEREVDLHISELIENTRGMTNGEMFQLQLDTFERELDEAKLGKIRKVTFIHGIGNGILKQEIRRILKEDDGVKFYDAPYSKYGFGATEVVILGR